MKFFLDTANVEEIKEAYSMGMIDGVTTNPTLVAKEGRDFEEIIKEICEIVDGPVSAEVVSVDTEGMLNEARHLSAISSNAKVVCCQGIKYINWKNKIIRSIRPWIDRTDSRPEA